MPSLAHMPPRGYYLAREVGQLAGVSGDRVGQWARRGYIRSSRSDGRPRVYSFQDVAEAMVVHDLLDRGVRHDDIKSAIAVLRAEWGEWPLTHAPLATGRPVAGARARIAIEHAGEHYDVGWRPWQGVINVENLRRIREDLSRGGWAVRKVPQIEHIEVDPDRLSGAPTIRGRRIAAEEVAELAEEPNGVELLRDGYDLDVDQIEDAKSWLLAARELAAA